MRKIRSIQELTEAEIRILLREKLRQNRQKQLQGYQRTGRAITLVRELELSEPSSFLTISDDILLERQTHLRSGVGTQLANHFLGFVELGVILSLVALLWLAWQSLASINQRTSAAWVFPTPTPTALIQAIVLPDGHTPPNRSGVTQPNVEEVPPHLRPIVQAYANIPTPTSAPHQGVRIQIPALNIDSPIVQGDGWEQLMKGVAQHLGTANPGEKGNMYSRAITMYTARYFATWTA